METCEVIGQEQAKQQLETACIGNRHVILVGPPGVGKTTLAKSVAQRLPDEKLMNCSFHCSVDRPVCPACLQHKSKQVLVKGMERFVRVQGSPDLTVEDLLGDIDPSMALKYGPTSLEAFTPGKIFQANKGVLFFDEINRCPEKLQNALLQVLEEGYATLGSYKVEIPANFLFIGTMNPEETAATEKLSDVFLDRFDIVYLSWPDSLEDEMAIVKKQATLHASLPLSILQAVVAFVRTLREHKDLVKHPSVRASIGLAERASAFAHLHKRDVVQGDDVRAVMTSVLAHRIALKPSVQHTQTNEDFIVQQYAHFLEQHPSMRGDCL